MRCVKCHKKGAKHHGQNLKSQDPYFATVYYICPHCGTWFSIEKSIGEVKSPDNPEEIFRRVMRDIASLPREKLELISRSVAELL